MSDWGKSNCIRICHSHTDWLRISTWNLRTVLDSLAEVFPDRNYPHIDPSCNTHAVRCYKTDYRVDPVNALTQLTTLGRYIVFRVHRCHVVRYPVARKQTADIDGLVILIIFCIRIGLIKIITAIGESFLGSCKLFSCASGSGMELCPAFLYGRRFTAIFSLAARFVKRSFL